MTLEWDEGAVTEYIGSARYYEERQEGLGDEFIDCIEAATARILREPVAHRLVEHGCRKVRVNRFPFVLVYAVKGEVIRVIAVMHQHREPGYWHERA